MGDDDANTIPTPYSLLFHPYLVWREKLISPLSDYMMGAHRLGISDVGTQEAKDALEASRKVMVMSSPPAALKAALQRWEKQAECPLAETEGRIPFLPNILQEWGIVPEGALLPEAATTDRKEVGVTIRFPSSLLKDCPTTVSEASGCVVVEFETIDWKTFAPDVPVVLQFHGGAFVLGIGDDVMLSEEIARLTENSTASNKDVINVCVDYALAPELAFPVAIMDALSVVDFFLNLHGRKSIHVSGISAGCNLALVAGMEGLRRFPGQIASIQAQSPYCNPGGDSLSYWMNQNVMPDNDFLRWGWRAYLGLAMESEDQDSETTDLDKALRKGSNHTSWKEWQQKYPKELHRLANPALDFPGKLNGDKTPSAPALIIRYNRGDPVHSDGTMVVEALKPMTGGNASFYETDGLHCDLFASYDATNPPECYKVWAEALFGSN